MRKWLTSLPASTLLKIAGDLGRHTTSTAEAVDFIVEQAKSHDWSTADLMSRFIR